MKHTTGFFLWIVVTLAFLFFHPLTAANVVFHVSPKGNDAAAATQERPLKTFAGAVNFAAKYRASHPTDAIEVCFAGGEYFIDKQIIIGQNLSGVSFVAAPGAEPLFYASKQLTNWKKVTHKGVLNRVDETARPHLIEVDLKSAGIADVGSPIALGLRPDLYLENKPQTLARWPNEGFTRAGVVRGTMENTGVPDWYKEHTTGDGIFEYTDPRIDRWAEEKEPCLNGYWLWDWAEEYQHVESIDVKTRTIKIKEPYTNYGYRDSCRYWGLNLLCEIDVPGEYYIDRSARKLYWYPPVTFDAKRSDVRLSVTQDTCLVLLQGCSEVVLRGLTFRGGRGTALSVVDAKDCAVADCRIESFGHDAIHVYGGSNVAIEGCYMQQFGCAVIHMEAGNRRTLEPCNHRIGNNVIEHFSLFKRTYQPALFFHGAGVTIHNNRMAYSASSAMRLEGNDIIAEYNLVHDVVNESDDQGGIDSWYDPSFRGLVFRYNYWKNIQGGTHNGAAGIRLDDMISGVKIQGNIFERCGAVIFGGVQIHGGKDNLVENNLFYDCVSAISFSPWGIKHWLRELDSPILKKKLYEDVDINSPLYLERYPELKNIREGADVNTARYNLAVNCKSLWLREKGCNVLTDNIHIPVSKEPISYYLRDDVQRRFFPEVIPVDKIGVKTNCWTK